MVEFSELPTSWKILLEKMTGNVVMSDVVAPTNVVLNKAEKYVPNGELVGATDCITLWMRCHTNQGRYHQIHLFLIIKMFKFSFIYSYFLFNYHKNICPTYKVYMMFDVHK